MGYQSRNLRHNDGCLVPLFYFALVIIAIATTAVLLGA